MAIDPDGNVRMTTNLEEFFDKGKAATRRIPIIPKIKKNVNNFFIILKIYTFIHDFQGAKLQQISSRSPQYFGL